MINNKLHLVFLLVFSSSFTFAENFEHPAEDFFAEDLGYDLDLTADYESEFFVETIKSWGHSVIDTISDAFEEAKKIASEAFHKAEEVAKKATKLGKHVVVSVKNYTFKLAKLEAKKGLLITQKGFRIGKEVSRTTARTLTEVLNAIPEEQFRKLSAKAGKFTTSSVSLLALPLGLAIGGVVGASAGGAGALPGALAGASTAGTVAMVLNFILGAGFKIAPEVLVLLQKATTTHAIQSVLYKK